MGRCGKGGWEMRCLEALLLGDGTSRAPLAQILLDRFGNYLAQRLLAAEIS